MKKDAESTKQKKLSLYTLCRNLWDQYNAPIIKVSNYSSINLNAIQSKGILTDQVIEICSSILKTPEIQYYVISKCDLSDLNLTDISLLQKYHYLQYLDLSHNNLSDLSSLSKIPYLSYLNVSHNKLKDISNFSPPRYLTYFNLSHNRITSIKNIENFWSIIRLDLSYNFIEKIPRLFDLKFLKYLNLSHNFIEYVQHLEYLNIQELNLSSNRVKKFVFLDKEKKKSIYSNLKTLLLSKNKISSLEFLRDLKCLRLIDLKDNFIEDLMEVFNLRSSIYEIDLRNNSCTKWPNYKEIILFLIPSLISIDGVEVAETEMVSAGITFNPPINLLASRGVSQLTLIEQLNAPKIDESVISYDEKSPPLIVLSGPLAVRKLALGRHISLKHSDKIKYCRSHTTRKKSQHDKGNDGFYFVDHEEFHKMARNGDYLTIEEILGDSYGLHNRELVELKNENKIGITQLDLLATIQIKIRYPQVKLILVLTKDEEIHRQWIEDKLKVYKWIKNSYDNLWALSIHREEYISEDSPVDKVDTDINKNLPTSFSSDLKLSESENTSENVLQTLPKSNMLYKLSKNKRHVKINQSFVKNLLQDSFADEEDTTSELNINSEEIISNSYENIQQRVTEGIINDNLKSSDTLLSKSFYKYKNINRLKSDYIESILKSRKFYRDHHLNNPGFYSLVVYSDELDSTLEPLKLYIDKLYEEYLLDKPKRIPEIEYLKQFIFPKRIEEIINVIRTVK